MDLKLKIMSVNVAGLNNLIKWKQICKTVEGRKGELDLLAITSFEVTRD